MKKLALKQMMGTITNVYRLWICIFLAVSTIAIFTNSSLAHEGEPRYVSDEITSPALEGNLLGDPATRPMWVWLPPSYDSSPERRYPTIYLLHHFTGTHMSYKNHAFVDLDIGEVAANLMAEGFMDEAILVLPDASNVYGGSFYSSNKVIGDYQTYITHDLVNYIDGKYRTIVDRESRSVFGHSMGGYGAFSLAIDYPEIFSAVAALGAANSDFAGAQIIDGFISENSETVGEPLIVQTPADYMAIVMTSFWTNAMYATGAAVTPNPDNPPFYVDLPVQYPEQTVVSDVWNQWLESDLVSQIGRNGNNLIDTGIYIDRGAGEVTIMPELPGIELLPAALDAQGLAYTYVEAEGDHMSHLRQRAAEALKFLSPLGTYVLDEITSPALEGNLLGDPATRPLWVWLPPSYETSPERRYPTIYLLHHFTGTHMSYKNHAFVDLDAGEVAANLMAEGFMDEAILVLPDASNVYGGSFYSSNEVIGDYQTYITHDLVNYIDDKYRTIADRESRSVFGHSMGGYGALSLAIDYPEIFSAVAALGAANSDLEGAQIIDGFISENPETLGEPLIVQTPADYMAIVMTSFWTNAMYATGASITPNPGNTPFYVDLPVQYPEKTIVSDMWDHWLESDLVSQIGRNGNNLIDTDIYIDRGVGEVVIMPELPGIELLPAALDAHGLTYTYVAAEGDHMTHLRQRTADALKFLSSAE